MFIIYVQNNFSECFFVCFFIHLDAFDHECVFDNLNNLIILNNSITVSVIHVFTLHALPDVPFTLRLFSVLFLYIFNQFSY